MAARKSGAGNRSATGRVPPTAWKPGQSGNPKGRPPVDVHVRDLARAHTEEAIAALVAVATDPAQRGSDRTAAAVALLDRGWGRPTERQEVESVAVTVSPEDAATRDATVQNLLRLMFPLAEEGASIPTGAPVGESG